LASWLPSVGSRSQPPLRRAGPDDCFAQGLTTPPMLTGLLTLADSERVVVAAATDAFAEESHARSHPDDLGLVEADAGTTLDQ
jgi:hypothetical protein